MRGWDKTREQLDSWGYDDRSWEEKRIKGKPQIS